MTGIKICGLSRPCDIAWANACRPDYIGFVFAKSRRQVSRERAAELKKFLDPQIPAVGVFVNAQVEEILELLDAGIIDMAQLHGQESEDTVRQLREISGKPVIKAFSVASCEDVKRACASAADYLLLDWGSGGTGQCFDWSLLREEVLYERPFFLAGGIRPENIEEAVRRVHPFAVDVSSGAETDGFKDKEKMFELVRRVRNV